MSMTRYLATLVDAVVLCSGVLESLSHNNTHFSYFVCCWVFIPFHLSNSNNRVVLPSSQFANINELPPFLYEDAYKCLQCWVCQAVVKPNTARNMFLGAYQDRNDLPKHSVDIVLASITEVLFDVHRSEYYDTIQQRDGIGLWSGEPRKSWWEQQQFAKLLRTLSLAIDSSHRIMTTDL
jgi:hypothetical protein